MPPNLPINQFNNPYVNPLNGTSPFQGMNTMGQYSQMPEHFYAMMNQMNMNPQFTYQLEFMKKMF
jgi:hypothetical protein